MSRRALVLLFAFVGSVCAGCSGCGSSTPAPRPPTPAPSEEEIARDRAEASWDAFVAHYAIPNEPGHYHDELAGERRCYDWSAAEILHAALDLSVVAHNKPKFEKLAREAADAIADYKLVRNGTTGYAPPAHPPPNSSRFRDDDGVIGLALLEAAALSNDPKPYTDLVAAMFPFFESGQQKPDGGVYWQDDDPKPNRGISATGSDDEVALRIHMATGAPERASPYRAFAELNSRWLDKALLVKEGPLKGLYYNSWADDEAQNPTKTGHVTQWMLIYNQGYVLGTDLLFYRMTHEKRFLDRAVEIANLSLDHWDTEGLWKQVAPFVAYFFRNILALDYYAPNPRYRRAFEAYLDRVWREARDPRTGLFDRGKIHLFLARGGGAPGETEQAITALNQVMFVEMFAIFAWPRARLPDLT